MQITVTFNSIEEMLEQVKKLEKMQLQAEIGRAAVEDGKEAPKKPEAKKAPAKVEKAAEEPQEKQEAAPAEEKPFPKKEAAETPTKKIGETEIKVLLSDKLKAGKKAQVKELFVEYEVENLSGLLEKHPDKLAEIYEKAEGI